MNWIRYSNPLPLRLDPDYMRSELRKKAAKGRLTQAQLASVEKSYSEGHMAGGPPPNWMTDTEEDWIAWTIGVHDAEHGEYSPIVKLIPGGGYEVTKPKKTDRWKVTFMRAGMEPPRPFGKTSIVVQAPTRSAAVERIRHIASAMYPVRASRTEEPATFGYR